MLEVDVVLVLRVVVLNVVLVALVLLEVADETVGEGVVD